MLQPITYSLIINLATLIGAGVLSYAFAQPALFVVAILVCTHALQRFEHEKERETDDPRDEPTDVSEYSETRAGFMRQ